MIYETQRIARRLDRLASGYRLAGDRTRAKQHHLAATTAKLLAAQMIALEGMKS